MLSLTVQTARQTGFSFSQAYSRSAWSNPQSLELRAKIYTTCIGDWSLPHSHSPLSPSPLSPLPLGPRQGSSSFFRQALNLTWVTSSKFVESRYRYCGRREANNSQAVRVWGLSVSPFVLRILQPVTSPWWGPNTLNPRGLRGNWSPEIPGRTINSSGSGSETLSLFDILQECQKALQFGDQGACKTDQTSRGNRYRLGWNVLLPCKGFSPTQPCLL